MADVPYRTQAGGNQVKRALRIVAIVVGFALISGALERIEAWIDTILADDGGGFR
jgi:hypothetical protein